MDKKACVRKDGRKELLFLLVFFVLSVFTAVLGELCLSVIKTPFIKERFLLFSVIVGILSNVIFGLSVWFTLSGKEILLKGALMAYLLTIVLLLLYFLLQKTGFFEVIGDAEKLQAYLTKAGIWMPTYYISLQFLQVVILPIPSIVSTAAGVALFGAFWATIYSLIGIWLGSALAFYIGRRFGNRAVSWLIGEETLRKWQKKMKGKDNLFLTLTFVLPLFPDDVLCFFAGLSSMSVGYFFTVIFFARLLGIAATCYSVDFIPLNTWWGIALWGVFIASIIVIFFLVYKNMDKIQRFFSKKKSGKEYFEK